MSPTDILEEKYGQYVSTTFKRLGFTFEPGRRLLDVGCGEGVYSRIFSLEFGLNVSAVDIYRHDNFGHIPAAFEPGSIYSLPFESESFDYVFIHDVLHHIDEPAQRFDKHLEGLKELFRVARKGGHVIIVEGNRYNPLFYPHMVKMCGHDHWRQSYFLKCVRAGFPDSHVSFSFFEAHVYPWAVGFFKIYEFLMEKFAPRQFLAYNVAIIKK